MSEIVIVRGSTYLDTLYWASEEFRFVTASLVPGAPLRIHAPGHAITPNWPRVFVEGSRDIEETKAQEVRVVDENTLELPRTNGTKFKATEVVLRVQVPVGMAGYEARMQIRDKIGGIVLLELTSGAPSGDPRIIINNDEKSIVRELPASITEAIGWKKGVFDLEMVQGDYVIKIDSGTVTVQDEVTK